MTHFKRIIRLYPDDQVRIQKTIMFSIYVRWNLRFFRSFSYTLKFIRYVCDLFWAGLSNVAGHREKNPKSIKPINKTGESFHCCRRHHSFPDLWDKKHFQFLCSPSFLFCSILVYNFRNISSNTQILLPRENKSIKVLLLTAKKHFTCCSIFISIGFVLSKLESYFDIKICI